MYQELIDKLKEDIPGYHIEISLFPSGGMIDVTGCEECKTDYSYFDSVGWRNKNTSCQTMDQAVERLKSRIKEHNNG